MSSSGHGGDVVTRFLTGDTAQRLSLLRDTDAAVSLRGLLGAEAFADLRARAAAAAAPHLGSGGPTNLVFLPGVMGSVLVSEGVGGVWWLDVRSRAQIDSLALASDGVTDCHPAFKVTPAAVDFTYTGFLTAAALRDDIEHLAFPYDWRKALTVSADQLYERILAEAGGRHPVHVVAHSMGGLVVRTSLMRHPDLWRRLGKLVFLGTPHYGSPAIGGYLKNHLWGFELLALLGRYLSRDTFRSLWGVLSLLPAPADVYPGAGTHAGAGAGAGTDLATEVDVDVDTGTGTGTGSYPHPCANFDLYSAPAWRLGLSSADGLRLQTVLDAVGSHHRDLHHWHASLDQDLRDRMAVIAGVGFRTLFRLGYVKRFGHLWEYMDRVTERTPGDPHRDGDGRVPLASAELPLVGETRYVRGEHGSLPGLTAVQDDVWRFLSDRRMTLPTSPKAALAAHLGTEHPGTGAGPLRAPDDPGYLDFTAPPPEALAALERAAEAGNLPGFAGAKLL